jgi:hypothetical protein
MRDDELADAKARENKLGNPFNLIKASADRCSAIGIAANVEHTTKRHVDLAPVIRGSKAMARLC